MSKIADLFHHEQRNLVQVFRKYIGTLALVFVLCMYILIIEAAEITVNRNEEYFLLFMIMALAGVFFTENCLRGKKGKEVFITGYILSAITAFLWVIVDVVLYTNDSSMVKYYFVAFAVFYVAMLTGLSLITLVRDSKLLFEQYAVRMIFSVIRVGLVLVILNLGFLLLFYMIDKLIVSIRIYTWLFRLELILTPVVYVPYILSCLTTRTEEHPSSFTRGIVLYALMPMYIAAVAIVYVYLIRILVTWSFPSNQVFMICAGVFSLGVIIWTMAFAFTRRDPSKLYNIIIRYMKYIVAPLIFLELYTLIIRINEYGWTTTRSLGMYFISLQIIYTAWDPLYMLYTILRKREKPQFGEGYEGMIWVILASGFFCFIFPWTSAQYVEDISQEKRFEELVADIRDLQYMDRSWTPEEYQRMAKLQYDGRSVMRVLESNIYGEIYLKSDYKKTDLEHIFTMPDVPSINEEEQTATYDEWSYSLYYNNGYPSDHLSIPVQIYDYFYTCHVYSDADEILTMEDLKGVRITYGMNEAIRVDLSKVVQNMTETDDGQMFDPTQVFALKIDNGYLVITQITFRYADRSKQVRNLQIDGYLFLE